MSDYDLYYWSVPFRGQFVRAVLAYAGKTWTEGGDDAIAKLMAGPVKDMPVPFMGPPVLVDKKADFVIAQMPAIVLYLGETLNLLPATPALRALTMKIVNDANDVIDEITLDGGREMWTEKRWQRLRPPPEEVDVVVGGDRTPPRPEGELRIPAGRRGARHRRCRDGHPVVDHDRPVPQDRGDLRRSRAHDGSPDAAGCRICRRWPSWPPRRGRTMATPIAAARSRPRCARFWTLRVWSPSLPPSRLWRQDVSTGHRLLDVERASRDGSRRSLRRRLTALQARRASSSNCKSTL